MIFDRDVHVGGKHVHPKKRKLRLAMSSKPMRIRDEMSLDPLKEVMTPPRC